MREQELEQEHQPAAEAKTAPEAPENPLNPLNDNVNAKENEKENDYVKDYVNEAASVKDKDVGKGNDFMSSLILDDFDDEEEYHPYGEGSASAYMEDLFWKEQENNYRQSQLLEEDRDTYV